MRNGVSWVRFPLRGFDFFWHLTGIWELASLKMSNNNLLYLFQVSYGCLTYCVVIENLHTPVEGIGNSWGRRGSQRQKKLKKCLKLNWNSQRGGGGWGCLRRKSFRGGRNRYFLELHIRYSAPGRNWWSRYSCNFIPNSNIERLMCDFTPILKAQATPIC